jgi:adenylate kinase
MDTYLFIGPPGSGKGSLSYACEKKFGWERFSTGNLCRKYISEGTEIGKRIDFALKSGILVSGELITQMVAQWMKELKPGVKAIILDGYPRTIEQARLFEILIKEYFPSVMLKIVKFHISDEKVIDRVLNRCICENASCQAVYSLLQGSSLSPVKVMTCDLCSSQLVRRTDDVPASIRERLETYHQHAQELIDFYLDSGHSVVELNVEKPLDEVVKEFKRALCVREV